MHPVLDSQTEGLDAGEDQPLEEGLGQARLQQRGEGFEPARMAGIWRPGGEVLKRTMAAFLFIVTGPSWQWSPTSTTCLLPITSGINASGSQACRQGEGPGLQRYRGR